MEWFIDILYCGISKEIPIGIIVLWWIMLILALISFPIGFLIMALQGTNN
jgi:hypothetical protein